MDTATFRKQFPFFQHHPDVVYLDSAATTLKPERVIEAVHDYLEKDSLNIQRGDYSLARALETRVEHIRQRLAKHLGAEDAQDIFFTSGTTDGMQKLADFWKQVRNPADHLLLAKDDHASTIRPWLETVDAVTDSCSYYGRRQTGDPSVAEIRTLVGKNTQVAVITHVHNIFGSDADVHGIRKALGVQPFLILDAAQSFGHMEINVQELGVDALVCSGHKAFADTGIGILYINKRLQEAWNIKRENVERGTLHLSGILSLGAALDVIEEAGINWIHEALQQKTQRLLSRLRKLPKIIHAPGLAFCPKSDGYGIVSFAVEGMSSQDVGFVLERAGFLVRTGTHCGFTTNQSEANDYVRISMHAYTAVEEIDRLADVLNSITT